MGKKGREIVKANVPELLETLKTAYANEWLFHYLFWVSAHLVSGLNSPEVAEMLKKASAGELKHAEMLAARIIQLGGEPIRGFAQAAARADAPAFPMPDKTSDVAGFIRAVIQMERHAIAAYQSLIDQTRHVDAVTHELAEELLAEEVAEEEEWENLLGE